MSDEKLPLPEKGSLVSEEALYLNQLANQRNTLAFGGSRDPSRIWSQMVHDDPACISYYRELEEKDDDVGDALDSLKFSVTKRDRNIEPGDDSQLALDAADFVRSQLDNMPSFENVLDFLLDMCGYGFSIAEMVFDVSMGQASLININDCPQELFLFGNRYRPQIGPLQLLDSPWAADGRPAPEEKFLIGCYRGRARNRMGRPLLRSVFWPSWFKRQILGLWLQYGEKGPGTAVVTYPTNASEQDKAKAAETAMRIRKNFAVAVPDTFKLEVELLKTANSISPDVYEHLHQSMQYSIARRILGQTLTSFGGEGGKGTQALGKVHQDVKEERSIALAKSLMAIINQQLISRLVLWNFGPQCPMPTWKIDVKDRSDRDQTQRTLEGAQRMGVPIPVKFLQDEFDIPAPQDGEAVAVPNPSAPTPPAGAASASFSEGAQAVVDKDIAELDTVMNNLRDDSMRIFKQRVKEVVGRVGVVEE